MLEKKQKEKKKQQHPQFRSIPTTQLLKPRLLQSNPAKTETTSLGHRPKLHMHERSIYDIELHEMTTAKKAVPHEYAHIARENQNHRDTKSVDRGRSTAARHAKARLEAEKKPTRDEKRKQEGSRTDQDCERRP